jgi:hypothetical protein
MCRCFTREQRARLEWQRARWHDCWEEHATELLHLEFVRWLVMRRHLEG